MGFENFIKGPVTSLLGLALMIFSVWAFTEGVVTQWPACVLGAVGVLLVFAKDKIPGFLQEIVDAFASRIKGK